MRLRILPTLLLLYTTAITAQGLNIVNYSASEYGFFDNWGPNATPNDWGGSANDGTFLGASTDWSGLGFNSLANDGSRITHRAAISPSYIVTGHTGALGAMQFYSPTLSQFVPYVTTGVQSSLSGGATLTFSQIAFDADGSGSFTTGDTVGFRPEHGIQILRIPLLPSLSNLDINGFPDISDYLGHQILVAGRNRDGDTTGPRLASNPLVSGKLGPQNPNTYGLFTGNILQAANNRDPIAFGDSIIMASLFDSVTPGQGLPEGDDSSGSSYMMVGDILTLIGVHLYSGGAAFDTFLPAYRAEIEALDIGVKFIQGVKTDQIHTAPEPSKNLLILLATSTAILIRNRRSAHP